MQDLLASTPVVLSINNLDPSGGGGISADIETLTSLGCHCTPSLASCPLATPAKKLTARSPTVIY
ncbi:bifunctional hydroxymethylpyrimidine kinase/phosphomethylpyrimidine kinase [Oceanicoccus sp. KOV_DT_Chl]|uniref:bifunctional hydroxymethylpyrimidine kinase/phosphomethylpyrimidine kinase n=1 Tax=Oceanicoccus sp. KOV_DT_Chl TaxID=1904639 RepID=UPI0011AF7869|nr:bifunctional hydroxymethylpyrimidine kinase/phosphomethylpyrimidine kinase [Oceanicoccus sp. KOV_DT_Chl]